MRMLVLAAAVVAAGCKNENDVVRRTQTDVFYQEPSNEVDILWVVDNSQSMADEQAEVALRFREFITSIEDANLDFHIGIVTTDLDPDNPDRGDLVAPDGGTPYITPDTDNYETLFQYRVQVGIDGSDREKGIGAAYEALTEPRLSGANEGFRRPDATLSIIYVSDENDCTDDGRLDRYADGQACYDHDDQLVSVRSLIDRYEADLAPDSARLLVSAIVGPKITDGCDGAVPGFRYLSMAAAFGGIQGSICEEDFSGIMENLGLQASGVLDSFQLSEPAVEETIEVSVDDEPVEPDPTDGWTYDDEYWILYFHGDAVPPRGSKITVHYEVASG